MKTLLFVFTLLIAASGVGLAQVTYPYPKIDTVTRGDFDDLHPVLAKSNLYHAYPTNGWLAFERWSGAESRICASRLKRTDWDTTVITISSSSIQEPQCSPSLAMITRGALAVWEAKKNGVWNIWQAWNFNDTVRWNAPAPLTADSIDNRHAAANAYNDTSFLVTWQRKNILFCAFLSPARTSPPETLAVSNFDSLDYDVQTLYGSGMVMWTVRDSSNSRLVLKRSMSAYPNFALSKPETLGIRGVISNPRMMSPLYTNMTTYELLSGTRREVWGWDGYTPSRLLQDTTANFRNAHLYFAPIVTAPSSTWPQEKAFYYTLAVVERDAGTDSALLFGSYSGWRDTVRTNGHNRDATFGDWMIYLPAYNSNAVMATWESNRSGKSHIYSRWALAPTGGVPENDRTAASFELEQNYPNPFNPATIISYQLSAISHVRLTVYDILGREIGVLMDGRVSAGKHTATWDGSAFASGLYFYRLQAGDRVETRKMILVK